MTIVSKSPLSSGALQERAGSAWSAYRRTGKAALHEPLVHFAVAGFLLFAAARVYQAEHGPHRIVVTPSQVAQISKGYALQFGEKPDPATLEDLVQRDIHDEILFRQGVALKVDQGDEIIRRRVVQKMQFLMQDLNAPAEPTDAQLQAYYDAHAAHYAAPPRTTFTHIYFSSDKGGDAAAQARAGVVLHSLSNTTLRAPEKGDPFPDLYDFSAYEPEQIDRLFGRTPFSDAAVKIPPGHWEGPFKSAYGWHLIYVDARQAASRPPLADVRDAVRADYLQGAQDAANTTAFDKLARDYKVVRQDKGGAK